MKFSVFHVDYISTVQVSTPRFKESPYECIKFRYALENVLARERLQIDTALLRIITSTADELSVGTNIDDLEA